MSPALADDAHFPPRRPGLWEISMNAGANVIKTQQCVDHATDQAMMMRGFEVVKKHGGTISITGSGNRFRVTTVIAMGGHTMNTTEDVVFVGDTAIQGRGHIKVTPPYPGGAMPDTDTTNDSKWVGACPAGLKPGQAMINGHTVDLMTHTEVGK